MRNKEWKEEWEKKYKEWEKECEEWRRFFLNEGYGEKEARILGINTAARVRRTEKRLRKLRYPCFEGDAQTKNDLLEGKVSPREFTGGWPCSVCKLRSSSECGLIQSLENRWAIFEPKIVRSEGNKLVVICRWCGWEIEKSMCDIPPETKVIWLWCASCEDTTMVTLPDNFVIPKHA